ncbi:Werner helicase interacting protein 1 [Perkinsus chesapeaki]|uniref:Werner helicase interacting protein 1 n=1 Tax=Perkinsus chesapeaki TaxID=330153 RepID=A0A7J6LX16_PERCH|nr:Werner helicase interacting protein 1 [Perkinsus chesapeaki]
MVYRALLVKYFVAPQVGADEIGLVHSLDTVHFMCMILWGPPGCGKTTLAQLLCRSLTSSGLPWRHTKLSAVNAGVNDVKKTVDEATNARRLTGTHTLLFLDEIHRFNKAQQDALLPHVENGTLTLIGATTENPSFQCNRSLVSRCQIIKLSSLDSTSIENILTRAMSNYYPQVAVDKEDEGLMKTLADFGLGDARASLNALELACDLAIMGVQHFGATAPVLRRQHVEEAMSTSASGRHRLLGYDKNGDIHYDLASALQKSIRGSDKDAAAYWTTRMLSGGEPPEYISRRLMRIASEDVGLADPQALQITAAAHTVTMATGMPECSTALLEAALYLCNAPKSNAVYIAYKNAKTAIENATEDVEVPIHLRNAPTGFMKSLGYGRDYVYTNQPRPTAPGEMAPHQTMADSTGKSLTVARANKYTPANGGTSIMWNDYPQDRSVKDTLPRSDPVTLDNCKETLGALAEDGPSPFGWIDEFLETNADMIKEKADELDKSPPPDGISQRNGVAPSLTFS